MKTKQDGAALRRRREMAGLSLEDVQELVPTLSYSRLSRVERDVPGYSLSVEERSALDRLLSSRLRQRVREFDEYMRRDAEAGRRLDFSGIARLRTASDARQQPEDFTGTSARR